MKRLLEKFKCHDEDCGHEFLVDMSVAIGKSLNCPFCGEWTESVANQNPDPNVSLEGQLDGCLYPM